MTVLLIDIRLQTFAQGPDPLRQGIGVLALLNRFDTSITLIG